MPTTRLPGGSLRRNRPVRFFVSCLVLLAATVSGAVAQLDFTGARRDMAVGGTPRSIAAGDLNGDLKRDLVVANGSSNTISILLNAGGGVFRPAGEVATSDSPNAVVLASLNSNSDAFLDMAVADFVANRVEIFLGNGAGGFGAPTAILTGMDTHPAALAVMDLNGDGKKDLAVVLNGIDEVRLYQGNGLGGFSIMGVSFPVPLGPVAIAVGDWDQSGTSDVAVVSEGDTTADPPGDGSVTVAYSGVGCPGSLCGLATTTVYAAPESIAFGTLNNDLYPDLVVGSSAGPDLSILYGSDEFGFTTVTPLAVGGGSFTAAVGDFNGDTKQDVAVGVELDGTGKSAFRIFTGNGFGTFAQGGDYQTGSTPLDVVVVDFAGSTALDLATANTTAASASLLVGNGDGSFSSTPGYIFPTDAVVSGITSADMNADGKIDLAVSRNDLNQVDLLQGSGTGTFSAWQSLILPGNSPGDARAGAVLFDRFNSDGDPDLAVIVGGSDDLAVFPGNGAGVFGARVDYSLGTSCSPSTGNNCLDPQAMAAGPLNDTDATHPDLVVSFLAGDASFPFGSISVLLQSGGGFGPATRYTGGNNPICLGGPNPGIACSSADDCSGRCSLSTTVHCTVDGNCPPSEFCVNAGGACTIGPTGLAVGLVNNGDANRDLMVCGSENNRQALGAYPSTSTSIPTGVGPQWPLLKDFEGNGTLDLAVVNGFGSTVSTYLGDGLGNFTPVVQIPAGPNPARGVLADLNLDGWDDLAVNNPGASTLSVMMGDGTGHFGVPVRIGTGSIPRELTIADYNADGKPDLVSSNEQEGTLSILLNASQVPQLSLTHAGTTTTVAWNPMFEASQYDVIRGTVSNLSQTASTVNLGTVICVENDSPDLLSTEVGSAPPLGTIYFYAMRNQDLNVKGSYGRSTLNKIRVPASGDCL